MTNNCAAILADPHPRGHLVYPYTDDNLLIQTVCRFASAGISKGEGVILIMARSHCDAINSSLVAEGLNILSLRQSGNLSYIVADDLLSSIMVKGRLDGILDERLFKSTVDAIINNTKVSIRSSQQPKIRIFGEMVSLLRYASLAATTRLEELWNEVIDAHGVSVLCAYALHGTAPDSLPESLIAPHSHQMAF